MSRHFFFDLFAGAGGFCFAILPSFSLKRFSLSSVSSSRAACLNFSIWVCLGFVMAREYIIYCDESDDSGQFYSNFYGGALLLAKDRQTIEKALTDAKGEHLRNSEFKWTKISEDNEDRYLAFVEAIFRLVGDGKLKLRIMFTQNINQTKGLVEYTVDSEFFVLYYHFIKLAFGLRYCNDDRTEDVHVSVYLDDVPDTREKFENFKDYLSSLTAFPVFNRSRIVIRKEDIVDVDSKNHIILQAVDVVLGSMQFRLNNKHKAKPDGKRRRGNAHLIICGAAVETSAFARVAGFVGVAASAWIHRCDQHEPRGIGHAMVGAGDGDLAVLQRLSQRIQHTWIELRQFVEEQHAIMRKRDFARPRAHAAAGQRGHAGGMMRRAKWPARGQCSAVDFASHRCDHRHFQQFRWRQRRQDRWQT